MLQLCNQLEYPEADASLNSHVAGMIITIAWQAGQEFFLKGRDSSMENMFQGVFQSC